MLPLLLIPSWALAIGPFLAMAGCGPMPRPKCGGRGAVGGPQRGHGKGPQRAKHIRGGMGSRPAHTKKGSIARAQEGINSKQHIIDM